MRWIRSYCAGGRSHQFSYVNCTCTTPEAAINNMCTNIFIGSGWKHKFAQVLKCILKMFIKSLRRLCFHYENLLC